MTPVDATDTPGGITGHPCFDLRRAGVLLHLTSLPFFHQHGMLHGDTTRFMDFLVDSGFTAWQMLPVQPVRQWGSPYQPWSLYAGNPGFITRQQPDLTEAAIAGFCSYEEFRRKEAGWLDDYALFMTARFLCNGQAWTQWPSGLRLRDMDALQQVRRENTRHIEDICRQQYMFFSQWHDLRDRARQRGLSLIGDMPIFPDLDSADVWAHQHVFKLDDSGLPTVVAGVPPDYFSETGQRWGNPVYDWPVMEEEGFAWWLNRLQGQLALFDMIRLDHFRGLQATWEIPRSCETAVDGYWVEVPGAKMLQVMYEHFGPLPIIAEDLGMITQDVVHLREMFRLPGMRVLQFAFDSDEHNPYLPQNHTRDSIVYTGTHDNDTTLGWYNKLTPAIRARVDAALGHDAGPMPWPLVRMALSSVAGMAIFPMQDLLGLDSSYRMNTPGVESGNWRWQFRWDWVAPGLEGRLRALNRSYERCGV